MKRTICLIFCFLSSGLVFGQKGQHVIGLQVSSYLSLQGLKTPDLYQAQIPLLSPAGGVYYDWNFSRQVGLNVSAVYRVYQEKVEGFCANCFSSEERMYRYTYKYLDLPVNLALNLTSRENAAWQTYFTLGYTFSNLLDFKRRHLQSGHVVGKELYWQLARNQHFLNAGFEVRHNFSDSFTFALSPYVRVMLSQEIEASYVGLNMKFGGIL